MASPCCIATDSVGNVFIAEVRGSSTLIHKFERGGHPLLAFYVDGVQQPSSLTVDYGGAIYLTNRRPGALYIYFPDGSFFRVIRRVSGRALEKPAGVAIDENGNICMTEADANRVLQIDSRGRLLKSWGSNGNDPGQFSSPSKITAAPDGSLFVADVGNHRIEKFRSDGAFVAAWDFSFSNPSPEPEDSKGFGVAASGKFVAASDGGGHLLQIWTPDGQLRLAETHLAGSVFSEPPGPSDAAFTPNGELLVLDSAGPRVLRFRLNF